MNKREDEVHISSTAASGGSKEGVGRWVLGVGLGLVVLFMAVIWITGALTFGDAEEEGSEVQQAEGPGNVEDGSDRTDAMLSEDPDPGVDKVKEEDGLFVEENN